MKPSSEERYRKVLKDLLKKNSITQKKYNKEVKWIKRFKKTGKV